jgi:hypothetical protein
MVLRRGNWVIVLLVAALFSPAAGARAQGEDGGTGGEAREPVDTRGGWPRVHIPDPVAARALRTALDRAWTSLQDVSCRRVLTAFTDERGELLEARLAGLRVDAPQHLTRLVFIDETRDPRCRTGFVAFTEPGSYVVRLCVDQFKRTWQQDPRHTIAALIHEMLHSLGLGENPPTSNEITTTVLQMCQPR